MGSKYASDCMVYAEYSNLFELDLFKSEAFVRKFLAERKTPLRKSLFDEIEDYSPL